MMLFMMRGQMVLFVATTIASAKCERRCLGKAYNALMRYKSEKGRAWEEVKAWSRRKWKDCFTCPAKDLHSYNAQAGHYRPVAIVGSNNNLAWDERFIRLQCGHCNGAGQGEQVKFRERLVRELGEEVVAEFDRQVDGKFVNKVVSWEAVAEKFKNLI